MSPLLIVAALLWTAATAPERAAFVAPELPGSATVWAVGDAAADTPDARRLARRIVGTRPDLFLYLGDVYPWGTAGDFRRRYEPLYGRLARRTAPTPGNHDWPHARSGYFPYWRRKLGRPLPSYYAFTTAGWRVLALNSELTGRPRRRQLAFVRRALPTRGDCALAFWHRPRYSAGVHGDAPDLEPLWRAVRGRARLVLNGHDHDLQRLRARAGTTILIAGAGGHSRYPVDLRDRRVMFASDDVAGALRLRLSAGRAEFAFVTAGGRVLDSGSMGCHRR